MRKIRKYLADKIYNVYDGKIHHFPSYISKFLYILLKDYRFVFYKIQMPMFGYYEYSDMRKLLDGTWVVEKTFKHKKFPELSTYEMLNVQPMTGPVGLTFTLKYVYE